MIPLSDNFVNHSVLKENERKKKNFLEAGEKVGWETGIMVVGNVHWQRM